ncbi:hypothetical protein PM738_17585 [Erysipelatoclostridium ramosum]|uniref:Replisome organizer n=1 Tax=Thomasclavelia ramosa TaxID=1547 RepID=A0AB35IR30_9FIRM|nr:hypothetical protein [Thomasclavelia ramosa]MDB7085618.1 hypothetical protein [Thomasclavelia ramosa]
MATKRMFSPDVVESDLFLDMSHNAQLLYFHLSMNADNEGFVNNPKTIIRTIGVDKEYLNELINSNFVIPFDSGVMVITHWRQNNNLDERKMKKTIFVNEKKLLIIENNIYIHVDSDTDTELLNSKELHGNRSNSKELHGNRSNSKELHGNRSNSKKLHASIVENSIVENSIVEDSLKENNIKENSKELSNIKSSNKEHEKFLITSKTDMNPLADDIEPIETETDPDKF